MTAGHLGVSSPVLDVFVRGAVPREVRLLAARGLATNSEPERLALLALMADDSDLEVAGLAAATIDALPVTAVDEVLSRPGTPPALRAFFEVRRPSAPADSPHAVPEATALPPVPSEPSPGEAPAAEASPVEVSATVIEALEQVAAAPEEEEEVVHRLLTALPVPDKIKLATLGRREQRAILIRDPNRIVSTAVMSSPKLTETEVEMFARMQNVSEEVLRIIGMSRLWVKSYNIVAALVKNPRTPPAVSLPLLPRLQERDVKGLTVNRNLPESVRLAAKKFMAVQQERRGG